MPAAESAAAARLIDQGFVWRRLVQSDLPAVIELPKIGANRLLLEEPRSQDEAWSLIRSLRNQIFGLPMVCFQGEQEDLFGMASTALPSAKNQSAYLLALFKEPEAAAPALALYIRHLFWNFPLERLYWHSPDVPELTGYRELYARCGFVHEGRLPQHAVHDGRRVDVAVYGLLREESIGEGAA